MKDIADTEAPAQQRKPVIIGEDLTREYQRGRAGFFGSDTPTVRALDDVSVSVMRGECLGVAGPSGSGKSTLLHLLSGLDVPTDGTVQLGDYTLSTLSERKRARIRLQSVGIVFQRFHLLPALSARANVALPLVELGIGKQDRRDRAHAQLEAVGLADRASHKPGQLSGGEQQRVAIARALITDPDLIVADEPTGELDTETGADTLSLLTDVTADQAVVIASHDQQALAVCDRRIQLQDGQIVQQN